MTENEKLLWKAVIGITETIAKTLESQNAIRELLVEKLPSLLPDEKSYLLGVVETEKSRIEEQRNGLQNLQKWIQDLK